MLNNGRFFQRSIAGVRKWAKALLLAAIMPCSAINLADAANGSVTYTYDALGRLSTASYDTGVILLYTYDANGNRTQQVINVNVAKLVWTATVTPCTSNCWGLTIWGGPQP